MRFRRTLLFFALFVLGIPELHAVTAELRHRVTQAASPKIDFGTASICPPSSSPTFGTLITSR